MCLFYGSEARTDNSRGGRCYLFRVSFSFSFSFSSDQTVQASTDIYVLKVCTSQPRPGVVDEAKQDSFLLVVEHSNRGPEPPLSLFPIFLFCLPFLARAEEFNYSSTLLTVVL